MRRHGRIVATVLALIGIVGAAASVDVTSAAWTDDAHFSAAVSSGQWGPTTTTSTTTTTTTTVPPVLPGDPNGGISSGNTDTVISGIVWSLNGSKQFCTEVRITGASSTPKPWQINIDLTQAPFYGVGTGGVQTNSTGVITVVNSQKLKITGNGPYNWNWDPRQNNTPITNAQTALLTICVYNAPVPPPAPASTYTVTYANGPWTDTQACVTATITTTRHDLATYPFYYGWSVPLDLVAAKARITSVGNTLNFVSWNPYPNGPTDGWATPESFSPPLDSYTYTSGFNTALRAAGGGADTRTVTACVNGYSTGNNGNGNGNGKGKNSNVAAVPTEESTPSVARAPESTTTVPAPASPSTTVPGSTTTTSSMPAPTGTSAPTSSTTTTTVLTTAAPPTPSSSVAPTTTAAPSDSELPAAP